MDRGRFADRPRCHPLQGRRQLAPGPACAAARLRPVVPASDGERLSNGPRVNALTDSENCDPVARTPYHKHVAVRPERLAATEAAACEERSRRIHAA
jgi:hypothetical protein